jgi:hypothetical protein
MIAVGANMRGDIYGSYLEWQEAINVGQSDGRGAEIFGCL